MKKYLLVLLLVGLFLGCSGIPSTEEMNDKSAKWLNASRTWEEFFQEEEYKIVYLTILVDGQRSFNIIEFDKDNNYVGMDRDIATTLTPSEYTSAQFDFANTAGDGEIDTMFFFTVVEGDNIVPGSTEGHIDYASPSINAGVNNYAKLDLVEIIKKNPNIKIGDEVVKFNMYDNSACVNVIQTFSYRL